MGAVDHSAQNKQFAEKNPEWRHAGDVEKGEAPDKAAPGQTAGQAGNRRDLARAIAAMDVAGHKKEGGFSKRVEEQVQQCPKQSEAADADAESDDAKMT